MGASQLSKARVPVPPPVRQALLAFPTKKDAMQACGIGCGVYADATAVGGILQPKVLAKIQSALGL